jgi:hypothetical protein
MNPTRICAIALQRSPRSQKRSLGAGYRQAVRPSDMNYRTKQCRETKQFLRELKLLMVATYGKRKLLQQRS